ncbi:MAG: metallophosphoesterase family protein [Candidatus Hodarchaeales archaeon]
MLRFAVISDIHANLPALSSVFEDILDKGINHIICLGDIIGYGPFPLECLEYILRTTRMKSIYIVKGNHDHYLCHGYEDPMKIAERARIAINWTKEVLQVRTDMRNFIKALPENLSLQVGDTNIFCCHGSPHRIEEYVFRNTLEFASTLMFIQENNFDICLMGHTHVPYIEVIDNDPVKRRLIANPGSVGQPRDKNPEASYLLLTLEEKDLDAEICRVPYDIDSVINRSMEVGLPETLGQRLYFGI